MGLVLLVLYISLSIIVFAVSRFSFRKSNNTKILPPVLVTIFVMLIPFALVLLSEVAIWRHLKTYCDERPFPIVNNSRQNVLYKYPTQSDIDMSMWAYLLDDDKHELLADVRSVNFVEKKGLYLFKTLASGNSRCLPFMEYMNSYNEKLKQHFYRLYPKLVDRCIVADSFKNNKAYIDLAYEKNVERVDSTFLADIYESRAYLKNLKTNEILVEIQNPVVSRKLFEIENNPLLSFMGDCTSPNDQETLFHALVKK